MSKAPNPNWHGYDLSESLGHAGQWRKAVCRACGEEVVRSQGGDLDDWWMWDFERLVEQHDHDCKDKAVLPWKR